MRRFLVTARDNGGKFIDQREIMAANSERATRDAHAWIAGKHGDVLRSTIEELDEGLES